MVRNCSYHSRAFTLNSSTKQQPSEQTHNPLSKETCFLQESAMWTKQPRVGYTRRSLTIPLSLPNSLIRRCGFQRRDTGKIMTISRWNIYLEILLPTIPIRPATATARDHILPSYSKVCEYGWVRIIDDVIVFANELEACTKLWLIFSITVWV